MSQHTTQTHILGHKGLKSVDPKMVLMLLNYLYFKGEIIMLLERLISRALN